MDFLKLTNSFQFAMSSSIFACFFVCYSFAVRISGEDKLLTYETQVKFFNLFKVIFRHQNQIEIYSVDFLLREENQRILRKSLKQGCISTKGLSRNNLWINERFIPKAQSHLEYSYHSKNLF